MSWDDFKDQPPKEEKLYKEPVYRSVGSGHFYCVFRIGKKMKSIGHIRAFTKHMERMQDTPNADPYKQNILLVGGPDLDIEVQEYIKDCKYVRPGISTVARELLLTASPGFFRGMSDQELQKWVQLNQSWLDKEFGSNLIYATLHLDEKTPHIHALMVPKVLNKKGEYILSNCRYFDGKEALRSFQDRYSDYMRTTFKSLNRGIKFSKAKHIEVRHFYTLLNTQINEKDLQQLCARAKNGELLEIKIRSIQKTLETYKEYSRKTDAEKQLLLQNNKDLSKSIKELSKDKELFHQALEVLSQQYKLPQYAVKEALRYASNQLEQSNERSINK